MRAQAERLLALPRRPARRRATLDWSAVLRGPRGRRGVPRPGADAHERRTRRFIRRSSAIGCGCRSTRRCVAEVTGRAVAAGASDACVRRGDRAVDRAERSRAREPLLSGAGGPAGASRRDASHDDDGRRQAARELVGQAARGMVLLHVTAVDADGQVVLDYYRCPLLPARADDPDEAGRRHPGGGRSRGGARRPRADPSALASGRRCGASRWECCSRICEPGGPGRWRPARR